MILKFDTIDLLGIDGIDVVDIDWPAATPKEVSTLNLPSADGGRLLDWSYAPMDVSIKFRLTAPDRDPDNIMGRWTQFSRMVTSKGLSDFVVSRMIRDGSTPNLSQIVEKFTYRAIVTSASAVEFKGHAGEATVTFHIPFPVAEMESGEGGLFRDGTVSWSQPSRYGNRTASLNTASIITYPSFVTLSGRVYLRSTAYGLTDLRLVYVIEGADTAGDYGADHWMVFELPDLDWSAQSLDVNIINDTRQVVFCPYTGSTRGSETLVLPTLDSIWLDPIISPNTGDYYKYQRISFMVTDSSLIGSYANYTSSYMNLAALHRCV